MAIKFWILLTDLRCCSASNAGKLLMLFGIQSGI
jgi:hypothetical protein